jgi:ABC-type lipoprotein release transport system permease subunit
MVLDGQRASSEGRLESAVAIVLAIIFLGIMLAVSAVLVGVFHMIGSGK